MAAILRLGARELRRKSRCSFSPACFNIIITSDAISRRHLSLSAAVQGVTPMELLMPALSPTMEVGTIKKWLKEEGEPVAVGDALCEVETDKATVTMDSDEDGIMAKILVSEGTSDIKINTLIAYMVGEGEDYKDVDIPEQVSTTPAIATRTSGNVDASQTGVLSSSQPPLSKERQSLSPAVRYLIDTHKLDPNNIQPTGPKNRILKGDVLRYMSSDPVPKDSSQPKKSTTPVVTPSENQKIPETRQTSDPEIQSKKLYDDIELSNMRKVIARRLTESKSTVPHAYSTIECTVDSILKLRKSFAKDKTKLSVNDFVIKAAAMALKEHPDVNSQWNGEDVVHMPSIDISVAVTTEQGLITPIVVDAASKGLKQISESVRDLASRARDGKLQLHEFQGGSFSISNLGMFGIGEFSAVINPPQACILAVGTSKVQLTDTNQARTVMTLTLSSDARVVDDALAAAFLQSLKSNLENPMRLGLL
ncbi:pyruvate dehydrogenase protein X component, mitochondrial-like [Anneissia japonica]|uniref:pyruvate dehydrogenase protein X component, mitochondrial-like n=1 Tax=Anneissia japonica TaxID=1529436 RepID=UPI001425508E|nr:pyruvate dehydrogenase protein X component, mitochondrial-like [Anneissia japonica]